MKAIAITNIGIEDISAKEIKEIIKADCKINKGFLTFEAEQKDLIKLCYLSQSITKLLLVPEDINEWIKGKTFAIRGKKEATEQIAKKIKGKVDLKNPDIEFYALDEKHFGIDLTGEDLGKRDYRIFLGPESIKGNLAYALVRLSDYNTDKMLLDPFCRDGAIPIEAALYAAKFSPHYFKKDKFNFLKIFPETKLESLDKQKKIETSINAADFKITNVNAAKKNAKIAGVNKNINFSKIQTNDLELKFQENSIDCIATIIPYLGKSSDKKINEVYKEIFYQAEYILNKKGKIVLLTRPQREEIIKKKAKEHKFKLEENRMVMKGKEKWKILIFTCFS